MITQGSYSDYSVVGIFSTKEKAQRALDSLPIYGKNNDVDEYELDELDTLVNKFARGYKIYWVVMKSDGTLTSCRVDDEIYTFINHNKEEIWGQVLAKNDKQAIKIVNDKRAQLIASGEL